MSDQTPSSGTDHKQVINDIYDMHNRYRDLWVEIELEHVAHLKHSFSWTCQQFDSLPIPQQIARLSTMVQQLEKILSKNKGRKNSESASIVSESKTGASGVPSADSKLWLSVWITVEGVVGYNVSRRGAELTRMNFLRNLARVDALIGPKIGHWKSGEKPAPSPELHWFASRSPTRAPGQQLDFLAACFPQDILLLSRWQPAALWRCRSIAREFLRSVYAMPRL